jgi:RNA polymerase sigma factor (sigma-70 family)
MQLFQPPRHRHGPDPIAEMAFQLADDGGKDVRHDLDVPVEVETLDSDEGAETELIDLLQDDESGYEVVENRELLGPGLRALDERERRIIHLRFVEGLTQSQIAVEVEVSQMHVSRLIRHALAKLSEVIEEP